MDINKRYPQKHIKGISYYSYDIFHEKHFAYYTFWIYILKQIKRINADIYIVNIFPFCFLIRVFHPLLNIVLDIRSGGVNRKKIFRILRNKRLKINHLIFGRSVILSESLAKRLNLNPAKYHVIPLGSEVLSTIRKSFDDLKLFYIGSLNFRRIHETLLGYKQFLERNYCEGTCYTIVGFGSVEEEELLINTIRGKNLDNYVKFLGRKSHHEIKDVFDTHNVGISYVPITEYYDVQPPTKTFEYLCSGMAVIATATYENSRVINKNNGVLIKDTAEDFRKGLEEIFRNRKLYDSAIISRDANKYTWEYIVDNYYVPYIEASLK